MSDEPVQPDTSAFEAARAEAEAEQAAEGVVATRPTLTVRDREFHLVPELPAMVMLDLALLGDDRTPPVQRTRSIVQFFEVAVVPDEVDAFSDFLRRAQPPIGMDELGGLVEKMTEVITNTPT